MNKETKILKLENRITRMKSREENYKSGGVLRKCRRQLNKLKNE